MRPSHRAGNTRRRAGKSAASQREAGAATPPVTFAPSTTPQPIGFTDPLRGRGAPPIPGGRYGASRDYGAHLATDYRGARGTPVYSGLGGGTARVKLNNGNAGNTVDIDHGNGYLTRYMHLDGVNVRNGQQVGPDDILGRLGMTGRATGPNLHYQVLHNGRPVNPAQRRR